MFIYNVVNPVNMAQQNSSQKPNAIRCSKELIAFLKKNGKFGESMEDIVWRMISTKKLTGEQTKDIKEASYEKHLQ